MDSLEALDALEWMLFDLLHCPDLIVHPIYKVAVKTYRVELDVFDLVASKVGGQSWGVDLSSSGVHFEFKLIRQINKNYNYIPSY